MVRIGTSGCFSSDQIYSSTSSARGWGPELERERGLALLAAVGPFESRGSSRPQSRRVGAGRPVVVAALGRQSRSEYFAISRALLQYSDMRAARGLEIVQGYDRLGRAGFQREGVDVVVIVVVGMLARVVEVVPALVDGFGTVDARRIQT